jgi:hypothetical protein
LCVARWREVSGENLLVFCLCVARLREVSWRKDFKNFFSHVSLDAGEQWKKKTF